MTVRFRGFVPKKSEIAPPSPKKKLTRPDMPIKHAYKFSMDKPPPHRYENQIGPGRPYGILQYFMSKLNFLENKKLNLKFNKTQRG